MTRYTRDEVVDVIMDAGGSTEADLSRADLSGVDLHDMDLRGTDLRGTDLSRANLARADLQGAKLKGADLRGANLQGANLQGADLTGANPDGANLDGADLTGADLTGADLTGADLTGADLEGADLRGADLQHAELSGCWIEGARLPDRDDVPVIPRIHREIANAVTRDGHRLYMSAWHVCDTTHCRAGWVIHLAGEAGHSLERELGTSVAAALIYLASDPEMTRVPDWLMRTDDAMVDILACARWEDALRE